MTVTVTVQIDFDDDGSFETSGDDISAYVIEIPTIEIGLVSERERVAAGGQAVIVVNNEDRRFSPEYSAGPYYDRLLPGRPVRIQATDDVDTWTLFSGVVRDIIPVAGVLGGKRALIYCHDRISQLQSAYVRLPVQRDKTADYLLKMIGSEAYRTARATGVISFIDNPSDGATVSVNDVTYTFKDTLTPTANEILIGDDQTATAENLKAALNGEEGSGTTYAAGTTRCKAARAAVDGEEIQIKATQNPPGFAIGRFSNGNLYWAAQVLEVEIGGLLEQFTVFFGLNTGSPSGTITWELRDYDSVNTEPGDTLYETGTFTPTGSVPEFTVVTAAGTTYLVPGTYCFVLKPTSDQTTGNHWNVLATDGESNMYTGGDLLQLQADPLGSWGVWSNQDMIMTMTLQTRDVALTAIARGAWGNAIELASSEGQERNAASITIDVGAVVSGELSDTNYADGNEYVLSETAGTPGFRYRFTFEGIENSGQEVRIRGYYDGTAGHTVNVEAWNGSGFDVLGTLPESVVPTFYAFTLSPGHTNSGEVIIRIDHTSAGDTDHRLHLDHLYVLDGTTTPADEIDLSGRTFSGGEDGPVNAISYETGQRTFSVAADTWDTKNTTAMRAVIDVTESEYGFFWAARDGTLTFKNATWQFGLFDDTPALTLSSHHTDMVAGMRLNDIYNRISVRYQPRALLAEGVVARGSAVIDVPPGKGKVRQIRTNPSDDLLGDEVTVQLRYVDPSTGQTIGAEDLITPLVAGTDYIVKNRLDEDVSDMGYIRTGVADTGSGCDVTFANLRKAWLTIHDLQVRGVGIVTYDPQDTTLDDETSQNAYGRRPLLVTLPLEASDAQAFSEALAKYLMDQFKAPAYRVEAVSFSNEPVVNGVNVLSVELGDLLDVTEAQTGVANQRLLVVGAIYSFRENQINVMLRTRRVDTQTYWILGDATYGVLGSTTRLAI